MIQEAKMSLKIEVVYEEMIQPSSHTPSHLRKYELSYFDQTASNFHSPFIFFYKSEDQHPNISHAQKSQLLKQSLSEALTLFYPLAGRIIGNDSIDCNDVGAVYKEAQARDPKNSSLSQIIGNPDIEGLASFLPIEPFFNSDHEAIPLLIQTTYFPCGGMVIGICCSHKFADASSFVAFINTWAAISRGLPPGTVQQPIFCLARLSPHKDNIPKNPGVVINNVKIVARRFVFNKKSLDVLKSRVISCGSEVMDPTRFEALSGFIWKHVKEAVAKSSGKTRKISGVSVLINTRQRLIPPQSQNSIGNFQRYRIALSPSAPDDDVVLLLRGIKEKFDAEYVKSLFSEANTGQDEEDTKSLAKQIRNGEVEVCSFTSLIHFNGYDADFGWGKPDWVSNITFPVRNMVCLMRTSSGDGIEAWINLQPQDMDLLECNPDFLSMTTLMENNDNGKSTYLKPKL